MSDETTRGRDSTGLADVRDRSVAERSTTQILLEKLQDRWQIIAAVVVLFLTSYGLAYVDNGFSKDALVFSAIAVLLAVYVVLTLRSDLKLE